jgi:hypothetical protein
MKTLSSSTRPVRVTAVSHTSAEILASTNDVRRDVVLPALSGRSTAAFAARRAALEGLHVRVTA